MTERKELSSLARLLGYNEDEILSKTDLQLIKLVVAGIKKEFPSSSREIEDSIAFPQHTRQSLNLIEANSLWHRLDKLNDQLKQDFSCRRQLLLRRLDCTVESFKWKHGTEQETHDVDKKKSNQSKLNDKIHEVYEKDMAKLKKEPQVTLANLLALRETECDRLLNEKVSSSKIDCKISYNHSKSGTNTVGSSGFVNLKQVIIPHVPDRGGRTDEHRAPTREQFSGQHRGGGGFRGRRHNDRRNGGGRHRY